MVTTATGINMVTVDCFSEKQKPQKFIIIEDSSSQDAVATLIPESLVEGKSVATKTTMATVDCLRQSEKQKIISVEAGSSDDASAKLILESLVEGKVLDAKIAQLLHPN